MMNKKEVLTARFSKLQKHYVALKEYKDLKFCIDSFEKLESYYLNSLDFAKKYM